jgi:hypothetical protein
MTPVKYNASVTGQLSEVVIYVSVVHKLKNVALLFLCTDLLGHLFRTRILYNIDYPTLNLQPTMITNK